MHINALIFSYLIKNFLYCALFLPLTSFAFKLSYLDHTIIPTESTFQGYKLGGFSGMAFDQQKNLLYALPDLWDDIPRIIVFKTSPTLKAHKVIILKDQKGWPLPSKKLDNEALIRLSNGHFIVSSEGIYLSSEQELPVNFSNPPALYEFNNQGILLKEIPVPSKITNYARPNETLESLAYNHLNKTFLTGVESPLWIDDFINQEKGGYTRFFLLDKNYNSQKELAYFLDPVTVPSWFTKEKLDTAINGLTELTSYQDGYFALERSFAANFSKNEFHTSIKIYYFDLHNQKPTDISMIDSLTSSTSFIAINKKLAINLEDLRKYLPNEKLDNFEGMTLGPPTQDGHNTIFLISDDNFSSKQKTILIRMKIHLTR